MATEPKVIAVVGATGAQGGGLVRAIVSQPDRGFVARAITRHPDSDAALALAKLGVEVVRADITDLESLTKAFTGAYGAYCVTNYWEILDPEKEEAQAANLAAAVKAAGVQHAIWSSLEDTRKWVPVSDDRMPTIGGRYKVPHYDTKGASEQAFVDSGVPTTFLMTSFYWENMIYFGLGPTVGADGELVLNLPIGDAPLPGIAASDIGAVAFEIFCEEPPATTNRIGIAGEHLTGDAMATSLSKALGRRVTYTRISPDMFRSFGFPGADDLGNMFQFLDEFTTEVVTSHPVEATRRRLPGLLTFDAWLEKNASRIPLG